MKICYIADAASYHTQKWVNHFISKGHEVHVISYSDVKIPGANVYYFKYNNKKRYLFELVRIHHLIKKIHPDILHAHEVNVSGPIAVTMPGYKAIVSAWGSDILVSPEKSKLMRFVIKYVVRNSEIITSDSFFMSEKIVRFGADERKVLTFPMGVDTKIFKNIHRYDLSNEKLNIISIRRLEPNFQIERIIRGFYKALNIYDDICLTVAASGTEEAALKKLAEELKIENKVMFLGSYKPGQIGNILEPNDVFISVPQSDSTSVSLLESMAVGVYPIVSDLPANKEWIKDKENGLVIEEVSEDKICEAIIWCKKNKKLLESQSKINRKVIQQKATWENNISIMENLYLDFKAERTGDN